MGDYVTIREFENFKKEVRDDMIGSKECLDTLQKDVTIIKETTKHINFIVQKNTAALYGNGKTGLKVKVEMLSGDVEDIKEGDKKRKEIFNKIWIPIVIQLVIALMSAIPILINGFDKLIQ